MTAGRWSSWSNQIPQFWILWWPAMKAGTSAMTKRQSSHVEACWLSQTQESQTEQIHPQTCDDPLLWHHWHDLHALGSHRTDSQQGILCWGFKGVQDEIPREGASTLQIGSVAFPPVHNSILVTDYLTKMGIDTVPQRPFSPDLAPCNFCLFPKLRSCRYETTEKMKEAVTRVIDTLTQEDFNGTFQKLLERYNKCICSRRRLLQRGLEFHVCTLKPEISSLSKLTHLHISSHFGCKVSILYAVKYDKSNEKFWNTLFELKILLLGK